MEKIFGLFLMFLGLAMVLKTFWFLNNVGRMEWSEKYLDLNGGSVSGYKLVGVLVFFIGFVLLTGWFDSIFLSILSFGRSGS